MIYDAFGMHTSEERGSLIECILYLKTYEDFQHVLKQEAEERQGEGDSSHAPALEPTVQGSLLAQSLLQCDPPHNQSVIQRLIRLPAQRLLARGESSLLANRAYNPEQIVQQAHTDLTHAEHMALQSEQFPHTSSSGQASSYQRPADVMDSCNLPSV